MSRRSASETLVSAGRDVYSVRPGDRRDKVATLDGDINAMDYDAQRKELWTVVNGHKAVRLNASYKVTQTYSEKPRGTGPFDPTRFAGVYDVAADFKGGFLIGEPGHAPRRIAHIARDGSLIDQWFGGMSFYVNGTFDPNDPSRLYGIAPEGWTNVCKIDYDAGTWEIEACYATGRLGDSLFPYAAAFRAIRRDGQLYLYHRVVPAVLRLDPKLRKAVPVAIAGRVLNGGRTFFQFAGSGRDGYPKPWVAAAEHHGYKDLSKAPKLYSWADTDGDGEFDPGEFLYYPMQTTTGPNKSVIVNDQTKQPAQVWAHDGLYVGGFFDNRADDGLADGFYQVHGDDNQGATVVTAGSGKTYWLMPYIGHNRLYEISGWDKWQRSSGSVLRPSRVTRPSKNGTGLTARYYQGSKLVLETIEAPIYYEQFGGEPHAGKATPRYKAMWTGFVEAPISDRFQFSALLGSNEQVAVWIDGKIVYTAGMSKKVNNRVELAAGRRHRIRVEYINPDGRSELKLLWSSRVVDPTRLPKEALYPDTEG